MIIQSIYILPVSIGLQFAAAFIAFRLIRTTAGGIAWALVAIALFLMGVRRSISFYQMLETGANNVVSNAELVALLISALMVAGVALIGPMLTAAHQAETKLKQAHNDLELTIDERTRQLQGEVEERKQIEKVLVESEERLLDAIESITDGVFLYDGDDRFVLCNSMGKKHLEDIDELLVPGTKYETVVRAIMEKGVGVEIAGETVDKQVQKHMEFHNNPSKPLYRQEKDGRWFMIQEYRTRDGGTFLIRTDVSELKKTQGRAQGAMEEAETANRAKSDFLANMSHELRTPLNAIIGFSDLIQREPFGSIGNPKYQEYIFNINESGQHLLELINNVLDVSAIEAGKIDFNEENMNLEEVVEASIRLVRPAAEKKRIKLEYVNGADLPFLFADELRLRQIIINLLSNAVKFTPDGGQVRIATELDGVSSMILSISDTGVGMSASDIEMAMEPFGRISSAYAHREEGTGLGLPLTKALVELHNGVFEIESEVGVGTTTSVRFPADRTVRNIS